MEQQFLSFPGSVGLSDFCLQILSERIGASKAHAQWVHYVAVYRALHIDD